MSPSPTAILFVYGTLLRGMRLSPHLAKARFLGHGRIEGALYDLGPFPALVEGAGFVYGELYAVERATLGTLDLIEGHKSRDRAASLYERRPLVAQSFVDGARVAAHGYFYCRELGGARRIPGGDYRRDRLERQPSPQWYLAYGSNLHTALLKRFGHDRLDLPEAGYLDGYALRFNK